jgi:hypothetical protein
MEKLISYFAWSLTKINKTHLQFALMLLILAMLVIGAGAPEDIFGGRR